MRIIIFILLYKIQGHSRLGLWSRFWFSIFSLTKVMMVFPWIKCKDMYNFLITNFSDLACIIVPSAFRGGRSYPLKRSQSQSFYHFHFVMRRGGAQNNSMRLTKHLCFQKSFKSMNRARKEQNVKEKIYPFWNLGSSEGSNYACWKADVINIETTEWNGAIASAFQNYSRRGSYASSIFSAEFL